MMSLYVPLLIVFLYDERERRNPCRTAVHNQALQHLLALGSKFPQEFRQIISQNSIYKAKLQSAVQGQQSANARTSTSSAAPSVSAQANRPQIVLGKIDVSKFVQKWSHYRRKGEEWPQAFWYTSSPLTLIIISIKWVWNSIFIATTCWYSHF